MSAVPQSRGGGIAGIVLAAGESSRFGSPKQLAAFRGRPLLEHALKAISDAPLERTLVVLGSDAERIESAVPLHGVEPVRCCNWTEGQAAALRSGIDAAGDVAAAVVVLGDQPLVSTAAIERVLEGRDPTALATRASYEGIAGHPVLLEPRALAEALRLHGDTGARSLLAVGRVREVPCDGLGIPADVDTPEDLEVLEGFAARGSSRGPR